MFTKSQVCIATMLQQYPGKLSFSTDAWTSPNHKVFIAVSIHLEKDGSAMSFLLDMVEVARSHSGVNLAVAFVGVLEGFGIEHKVDRINDERTALTLAMQILSVTCDNASPNDVMIDELESSIESFSGSETRSRCFDHIINLVAKTMIKQFDIHYEFDGAEMELQDLAKGEDIEEAVTLAERDAEGCEDDETDEKDGGDNQNTMSEGEQERMAESARPVKRMLVKVR